MSGASLPVPNPHDTTGVDASGDRDRGRRVLVLSTVDNAADRLSRYTNPDDTIKVVVPAVRQSFLDWLANDQEAFAHAEKVAAETAAGLPGHTVRSSAGEADVALAICDALATFAADEIIVAIRNDEDAGIVESMATKDAPRRSIGGVPVRCVVVGEA